MGIPGLLIGLGLPLYVASGCWNLHKDSRTEPTPANETATKILQKMNIFDKRNLWLGRDDCGLAIMRFALQLGFILSMLAGIILLMSNPGWLPHGLSAALVTGGFILWIASGCFPG